MQDMKVALFTIEDLKKNHPDYYRRLNPKCQVCQNILRAVNVICARNLICSPE